MDGSAEAPLTRECVRAVLMQFMAPSMQHVRIHLAAASHLGKRRPEFQSPNRRFLELLRELPTGQPHDSFSVRWILSLDSLSHFGGPLRTFR